MREAARHLPAAADAAERVLGGADDRGVECREAVPGDRGLERLADDTHADQGVAEVGRVEEGAPPGARGAVAIALRAAARGARAGGHAAAVVAGAFERAFHPCVERMVGRLERDEEHGDVARHRRRR